MATDICVRLGQRIRELRKARGWRQIDLAVHADVGKNHICELERGTREIGLRYLMSIAKALDTTPDVLLKDLDKE